ncbi:hypothetical protein IAU60_005849 [Kwoniella sp. DSM 27419]
MNKRPGASGLPSKPYVPPAPGPAPPLPAGPPPAQQYGQQQGQDQAHAAAWAAYYQSQGITAAATGYASPAQPAATAAAAPNPYANYGYGAGAQHASTYQQPQAAQPLAGPSQPYRPPQNTQPYAMAPVQPGVGAYNQQAYVAPGVGQPGQVYGAQGTVGYQTPQAQPQVPGRPPYQQPNQQGYNAWNGQQPQQGYRPPPAVAQGYQAPVQVQAPQVGPYYPGQQPQQPQQPKPFVPQNQPYRPSMTPQPMSNTPYRPAPSSAAARPPRPPMSTPPHPGQGGFPPAKRPRFDGPGGNMNGPGAGPGQVQPGMNNVRPPLGPALQSQSQTGSPVRPPTAPAAFGMGLNGGQPGFNAGVNAGPGGRNGGQGRGGAPVPISRPPIHLGGGGPPPQLAFGGPRGMTPLRGGMAGRGRGGSAGPLGAPRGPSGMRRPDARASLPPKRDLTKDKPKDRKRESDLKTTMTDFRIVGIELKGLRWSWGKVGVEDEEAEVEETAKAEPQSEAKEEAARVKQEANAEGLDAQAGTASGGVAAEAKGESDLTETAPKEGVSGETADEAVKEEPGQGDSTADAEGDSAGEAEAASVEAKRGEKRKAKSPDAEDETLSKKRPPYLLTHNKPNPETAQGETPTAGTAAASVGTFESNQNRFRIYFDSPPELDRIPKSERRSAQAQVQAQQALGKGGNPHKRVRESSSAAPSRAGDAESEVGREAEGEVEQESGLDGEAAAEAANAEQDESTNAHIGEVESTPLTEEAELKVTATGEDIATGEAEPIESVASIPDTATSADTTEKAEVNEVESEAVLESLEPVSGKEGPGATAEPAEQHGTGESETSTNAVGAGEQVEEALETEEPKQVEQTAEIEDAGDVSMVTNGGDVADIASALQSETAAEEVTLELEKPQEVLTGEEATNDEGSTMDGRATVKKGDGDAAAQSEIATTEAEANGHVTTAENPDAATLAGAEVSVSDAPAEDLPNGSATASSTPIAVPSTNRLSILYEKSSRRICVDSEAVEKVRIWRKEGRIEVELRASVVDDGQGGEAQSLKGVLTEKYDTTDQRFVSLTRSQLSELYLDQGDEKPETKVDDSIPPFHRVVSSDTEGGLVLTVHLNKKNPLSEPKWCRTNGADGWLFEQFGAGKKGKEGWSGKLEVMDPDPAPTLQSMLDSWASSSTLGSPTSRRSFTASLLSSPLDTLEILLRLTRGERNPPFSSSSNTNTAFSFASVVRPDSPYASHQTHVSLAVLAMYRLTTDLAEKMGEKEKAMVEEQVGDIVRSLPGGLITRGLDGMWKEWSEAH